MCVKYQMIFIGEDFAFKDTHAKNAMKEAAKRRVLTKTQFFCKDE